MGYKDVCIACRKSFNRGTDETIPPKLKCPECAQPLFAVDHNFKPPAKKEIKKWEVVAFLLQHGFKYDHLYEWIDRGTYRQLGRYPETMPEARELVENFHPNGYKKL